MLICHSPGHRARRYFYAAWGLGAMAAGSVCLAQNLPEPAPQLREVVVTASGFEQDIREAPASITVISREELAKGRFGDLTQALESVEGLDVGAAAGKTGGLQISIRGMPSDYTLVLIDGRRQNVAGNVTPNGFGGTQTSFMPPLGAIERIEIIRGPMSTLYGSDAMGGVINIITRKVGKAWTGSVDAENTWQLSGNAGDVRAGKFYLSGPVRQDMLGLSLHGSMRHRQAADVHYHDAQGERRTPVMGANPVRSDVNSLGLKLALTPNQYHDITLDLDAGRQAYDNSRGQLGTLGLRGGYRPQQRYNRDQVTLAHDGRYGFGAWHTSFMVNRTETLGRSIPPGTPGAVPGSDRTLRVQSKVLDSLLTLPWGEHLTVIGGQWWDAQMQDGVASQSFSFQQKALFAEDEWRLTQDLRLTLGARYDRHSVFGGKLSPRIYAVWNVSPQWTLKGGVSNGYKTPRVEQLAAGINGFGRQGTLPLVGSPGLKPETSRNTELGVYFVSAANWRASATLFHNDFKDRITSGQSLLNCSFAQAPNRPNCVSYGDWPGVDTFGQSVNVDKAVTQGVELSASIPMAQGWKASANYTYTRSEQKSGPGQGLPLTDTPKHALNTRLQWTPAAAWDLWLRAEYRSERYRPEGSSASSRSLKATLGNYKAYGLIHVGGSYRLGQQWTVHAAIYNLLNKNFVDYQAYWVAGQKPTLEYANRYVNPQEGRRLWLSANYTF